VIFGKKEFSKVIIHWKEQHSQFQFGRNMMASDFGISRKDAIELCKALGWKGTSKWNKSRMLSTLEKIRAMVQEDEVQAPEDHEQADYLNGLLEMLGASSGDIEVTASTQTKKTTSKPKAKPKAKSKTETEVEEGVEEEKPAPKRSRKQKSKPKPKSEPEPEDEDEDEDEDEKEEEEEEEEEEDKPTSKSKPNGRKQSEPGPDVGKVAGVKSLRNRLFCAGVVLKKHGIEKGVTEKMIAEVDKLYGRSDMKASKAQLVGAWHVLNGFTNGD
jgi:hypothetical protein